MRRLSTLILFVGILLMPVLTWAATTPPPAATTNFNYTPLENIPGQPATGDFYTYVSYIYKFGIGAVGIAALLMITIGGFMYAASAGNNSSMDTAKKVITDAIVGLVLALSSWLILNTINPDLVNIKRIQPVTVTSIDELPPGSTPATGGGATSAAGCKSGTSCVACVNCAPVTSISCKETPCLLNVDLIARLQKVNSSVSWRITEPWPPTVVHDSSCHANGTCADINILSGTAPADVKKLSDALKAAGFTSFTYENKPGACGPYDALGIPCKSYPKMTSPSFHVNNN